MDIHRHSSNTCRVIALAFWISVAVISGAPSWSANKSLPMVRGLRLTSYETIGGQSDTVNTSVALTSDTTIYEDSTVDTATVMLRGSPSPVYPAHLRSAGIGGSVVLRFVVDEKGLPDANHVVLVASPDPNFTSAVYRSLYYARFKPAILRGQPVRQWVMMRFDFKVDSR